MLLIIAVLAFLSAAFLLFRAVSRKGSELDDPQFSTFEPPPNARPGLAIQSANGRGLLPRLQAIDVLRDQPARTLSLERIRKAARVQEPQRKRA